MQQHACNLPLSSHAVLTVKIVYIQVFHYFTKTKIDIFYVFSKFWLVTFVDGHNYEVTKIKRLIESSKRPLIEILAQCSTLFNSDCEHGENNLINQIDLVNSQVYGDKVITAQQQTNLADVDDLDLNSFANTIL